MAVRGRVALLVAGLILSGAADKLPTRAVACERPETLVVERGMVYVYVQENVRGLDMDRHDDDPDYPTAPPRVVRYGTTLAALARRAALETRGLAGC